MPRQQEHQPVMDTTTAVAKKWAIYVSLLLSLVALGRPILIADGERVRMEEHLRLIDFRLDKGDLEWAKKDVFETRMSNIEKSQQQAEVLLKEENKVLEQIEAQLPRR